MSQSVRVPLIYGAAGIGAPGTHTKVNDLPSAQALIDVFVKSGHAVIDTSRIYGLGTSEEFLGKLELRGARVDTKVYPLAPGDHASARLKELFHQSLKALRGQKIQVFYLHAPDRSVPFEDTVKAVDELYKEGHFEEFGLSNYNSWEVAEIVGICKANGYVLPTVYEGIYNCLDRTVEVELIPCIRKYGLRFAAYSPLAGGFLVGIHLDIDPTKEVEPGSHFDDKLPFGGFFRTRYLPMVSHVKELRNVAEKHGLSLNEVAVRWLQHNSVLTPQDHGIIFGGSKVSHIEQTLKYNHKGPLPEEVYKAVEDTYAKVNGGLPNYNL